MKASRGLAGIMPLLDVLFILLFSLLALTDVRTAEAAAEEVRVELPAVEAGDSDVVPPDLPLSLSVDVDGQVTTGTGLLIEDSVALEVLLQGELGDRLPEELTIELSADRGAPSGVVIELLQALRLRGVHQVQVLAEGDAGEERRFGEAPR
jgi:biopolymer transport protein ExbD